MSDRTSKTLIKQKHRSSSAQVSVIFLPSRPNAIPFSPCVINQVFRLLSDGWGACSARAGYACRRGVFNWMDTQKSSVGYRPSFLSNVVQ